MIAKALPIHSIVIGLLLSFSAVAADKPTPPDLKTGNLTGTWELTAKIKGEKFATKLQFKKDKVEAMSGEKKISYHPLATPGKIFEKTGDKSQYLGAFIEQDDKKRYRLAWVMEREKKEIKVESSIIIKQNGTIFVLGGDFEEEELARITKLED